MSPVTASEENGGDFSRMDQKERRRRTRSDVRPARRPAYHSDAALVLDFGRPRDQAAQEQSEARHAAVRRIHPRLRGGKSEI